MDDTNVAHISEIENRMWKQTKAYGVAVSGLADTGLPVGPGKQDHLSLLHKAGQMGAKARKHWGGDGMGWSVSKAGEGKREGKGILGGGTAIAVHEGWNYRADDVVMDRRGWGRYTLRMVRGAAGKDAIFGTVYGPQSGSAHWKVQEKEMPALRNAGVRDIGDDPTTWINFVSRTVCAFRERGGNCHRGRLQRQMGDEVQGREGVEVARMFRRGPEAGKCNGGEAWEPSTDQV